MYGARQRPNRGLPPDALAPGGNGHLVVTPQDGVPPGPSVFGPVDSLQTHADRGGSDKRRLRAAGGKQPVFRIRKGENATHPLFLRCGDLPANIAVTACSIEIVAVSSRRGEGRPNYQ